MCGIGYVLQFFDHKYCGRLTAGGHDAAPQWNTRRPIATLLRRSRSTGHTLRRPRAYRPEEPFSLPCRPSLRGAAEAGNLVRHDHVVSRTWLLAASFQKFVAARACRDHPRKLRRSVPQRMSTFRALPRPWPLVSIAGATP